MTFTDERWVRIMCDYSADGVWHKDGAAGNADQLPVDKMLVARIRRWQDWWESCLDRNSGFDVDGFSSEGLSIAQAVKLALPDWTVIYFDQAAVKHAGRHAPRNVFEYEIEARKMNP
jgi:hypothetical protein